MNTSSSRTRARPGRCIRWAARRLSSCIVRVAGKAWFCSCNLLLGTRDHGRGTYVRRARGVRWIHHLPGERRADPGVPARAARGAGRGRARVPGDEQRRRRRCSRSDLGMRVPLGFHLVVGPRGSRPDLGAAPSGGRGASAAPPSLSRARAARALRESRRRRSRRVRSTARRPRALRRRRAARARGRRHPRSRRARSAAPPTARAAEDSSSFRIR